MDNTGKKIRMIALMLILIFVILIMLYSYFSEGFGLGLGRDVSPKPIKVERVDLNSGALITKTMGEWEELGSKEGMYKNPTTNQYTMVNVMRCSSCHTKIPRQSPPENAMSIGAEGVPRMDEERVKEWYMTLKCPRCGKNPFQIPE